MGSVRSFWLLNCFILSLFPSVSTMRPTRTLSIKVRPSIQSLMHRRLFVDFLVDLTQPIIFINYHHGAVAIKLRSFGLLSWNIS